MSKFDDELKLALQREEPSPDFTNRVMARIAQLPATDVQTVKLEKLGEHNEWWRRLSEFFRPPQMKWAMAGAMAVVLFAAVFGVMQYREHQLELRRQAELAEQAANAEGERAKEQVMLAMRIASAKLNVAQKKVQETSER
jgi:hypothetical protein